jgi:uncharacterized protein YjeT (DUF2065 family)
MDIVIKILGLVIAAIGIVYIIKPNVMNRIIEFFKKGKRLYIAAPVRLALAVVFLLGARECRYFWVIFAFGILLLISGILVLVLGPKKLTPMLEWWLKQPTLLLRLIALIAVAFGIVIIISA